MRAARNVVPVVLLLGLMLGGSGCTAIGFVTGSLIDASAEDPRLQTPAESFGDLRAGEELRIYMVDGTQVRGHYSAWEFPQEDEVANQGSVGNPAPPAATDERIATGHAEQSARVQPRDTLILRLKNGVAKTGQYLGADMTHLYCRYAGERTVCLVPHTMIFKIRRADGREVPPPYEWKSLRYHLDTPMCLSVVGADGMKTVPVRDIFRVQRERRTTYYGLILGSVGLIIDTIVVLSAEWKMPSSKIGVSF